MIPVLLCTLLHLNFLRIRAFVDPTLQDNVLLPDDFIEYIYHVVSSHDLHSIIQSGLILGWKCEQREACGVLYNRKSDVRRSAQRSRVRPDESQNCSVQKVVGKFIKYRIFE